MARDKIHYEIRQALEKDGWEITADPYYISVGNLTLEIDLEAEKIFEAEKEGERILVEIKTFNRPSILNAFYEAYGQYDFYRDALTDNNIEKSIYLALSIVAYNRIKGIPFLMKRIAQHHIKLIVVDIHTKKIIQWIH